MEAAFSRLVVLPSMHLAASEPVNLEEPSISLKFSSRRSLPSCVQVSFLALKDPRFNLFVASEYTIEIS